MTSKRVIPWSDGTPPGDRFRGEIAENYLADRINNPLWAAEDAVIREYLSLLPDGWSVLDVPFGTGRFVDHFKAKGMKISGLDSSADMLAAAEKAIGSEAFREIDITIGRAEALPYSSASFDLVVCVRFLESIIPAKLVPVCLRELRRVTRRKAIVCLNHGRGQQTAVDPELPLKNRLSEGDIRKILEGNGWIIEDSRTFRETATEHKRLWLLTTSA